MTNQAADFTQIVGKTIKRAYIDGDHQNVLINCSDETWYNISDPQDSAEAIYFAHIIGVAAFFEGLVVSINVIDALDASITTNKGTVSFETILVHPNYINGQLDIYPVSDVSSFDDNRAVRLIFVSDTIQTNPNNYKEIVYELLSSDI